MNAAMKHRLGLLFGLLATGMEVEAAEWTQTIDISSTSGDRTADALIVTGAHGFSVGTHFAIDPDGRRVGPYDIPEQIGVQGDALYSSRRGLLWQNDDYNAATMRADGAGNLWISKYSDFFSGVGSIDRLAQDGASRLQVEIAPDRDPPASAPLVDRDGALIAGCLSFDGASGGSVRRVDARGRTLARWDTGSCAKVVVDDLAGGAWVAVKFPTNNGYRLTHLLADGSQWPQALAISGESPVMATREGGVITTQILNSQYAGLQYLDANRNVRFRLDGVAPSALHAYDHGFWLEAIDRRSLTHIDFHGVRRTIPLPHGLQSLDVLQNGLALIRSSHGLSLYSPNGQQVADEQILRLDPKNMPVRVFDNLLSRGWSVLLAEDDASAWIPLQSADLYPRIDQVRAGANRICVASSVPTTPLPIARIDCIDRRSGVLLSSLASTHGRILDVDGDLLIHDDSSGKVLAYDAADTQRFALPPTDFAAADSRFGIVTRADSDIVLYDLAGQPRSRVGIPAGIILEQVRWSDDGGLLVSGFGNSEGLLFRLSANGEMVGTHRFANGQRIGDAIDTETSVLVATRSEEGRGPPQMHALSRDLSTVLHSEPAPGIDLRFWKSTLGGAWLTGTTPGSVALLHIDAGGAVLHRQALVLERGTVLHVAGDGRLQATDSDPLADRYRLRRYQPTTPTFSGLIRQSALAGAWFNPASTGQGLLLQLLNGNVLFGAWHTYAPEGGNALSKQQWFTVTGELGIERGRVTLPIYRNANGRFDVAGVTPAEVVGSAELVFNGCDQLEFWYRIGDDSGALPMQRLTPRTLACDDGTSTRPAADAPKGLAIDGAWLDPEQSGQGFTFNTTGARFGSFLAGWFTYDAEAAVDDATAQHWFTLQGATPEHYGQAVPVRIHRTLGGSRAGSPTLNTHAVGNALLTLDDCAHARLDYVFDDSVIAGPFANRSRSMQLQRLGACAD